MCKIKKLSIAKKKLKRIIINLSLNFKQKNCFFCLDFSKNYFSNFKYNINNFGIYFKLNFEMVIFFEITKLFSFLADKHKDNLFVIFKKRMYFSDYLNNFKFANKGFYTKKLQLLFFCIKVNKFVKTLIRGFFCIKSFFTNFLYYIIRNQFFSFKRCLR